MENPSFVPALTRLFDMQLQQFKVTQELVIALAAIQEVMKDRVYADFQSDHQKKIQDLKQGALGQQIAQNTAAFGREIQRLKAGLA